MKTPITKPDPYGRNQVALDSRNQPTDDYGKIVGWAYHPDDLPIHAGAPQRRRKQKPKDFTVVQYARPSEPSSEKVVKPILLNGHNHR